jgi:cell division septum initiation protein DivIVA
MSPSEIDAKNLPRRRGGYAAEETEALLTRAAWAHRQALKECEELSEEKATLEARISELEQLETRLRAELAASEARADRAGELVTVARRAALETREVARHEAELMLRKVRKRVAQIEQAAETARAAKETELLSLRGEEERVRERLRSYLTHTLAAIEPVPPAPSDGRDPILRPRRRAVK